MFSFALFAVLFSTAHGQEVELTAGETILAPCLEAPDCGPTTMSLLSEIMVEVGLTLQRDPLASSALVNRGYGVVTELAVDSLPIGRLRYQEGPTRPAVPVPLLPRLAAGYQVGSYTFDDPYPQLGGGVFLFPPIPVAGMSALSTGGDLSAAFPVYRHHLWVGADANYTFTQIRAQLVATREQLDNLGPVADYVNADAVAAVCNANERCKDRFTMNAGALRFGFAVDPVPTLTLYSRFGAVVARHALWVGWDETLWTQLVLQPQFQLGGGVRVADKLQLTVGTSLAYKAPASRTDGVPVIAKVVGSISYRWGHHRYWYQGPKAVGPLNK